MKKKVIRKVPFVLVHLAYLLDGFMINILDDFPEIKKSVEDLYNLTHSTIVSYFSDFDYKKFDMLDYSVVYTFEEF